MVLFITIKEPLETSLKETKARMTGVHMEGMLEARRADKIIQGELLQ